MWCRASFSFFHSRALICAIFAVRSVLQYASHIPLHTPSSAWVGSGLAHCGPSLHIQAVLSGVSYHRTHTMETLVRIGLLALLSVCSAACRHSLGMRTRMGKGNLEATTKIGSGGREVDKFGMFTVDSQDFCRGLHGQQGYGQPCPMLLRRVDPNFRQWQATLRFSSVSSRWWSPCSCL